ncbi:hypothetical protein D9Q98_003606 [Chlorella vulgaris]|uniref:DUF155 domain-containing protein n=1 Tax=Chlorella vulgaris TaxID=3077 RepID=A0A9D4YYP1_CHLVU|nr:hypothetical protein D9Q98_003606 [Chlorella vulgaris]
MDTVASLALPEVLVLSEPEPQNERDRRSRSVPAEMRRARSYNHRELPPVGLPPVHLPVSGRTIGRHVSLGPGWELNKEGQVAYPDDQPSTSSQALIPPLASLLYRGTERNERIRCYCVAEGFDRYALQDAILRREGSLQAYAEVVISEFHRMGDDSAGQVYYFDFGCVVFWGLSKEIEKYILREVVEPCMTSPLSPDVRETDRMHVRYTNSPKHHIENDLLALHHSYADDPQIKLAISFALAQSTKLSVLEERTRVLGRHLSRLPVFMAETGEVPISEKQIMQHIGTLFQAMSAVNLLGRVLDIPDSITSAPDNIGSLYKSVFEYLEVHQRVHLLNDRFSVMQELLDILRVHVQTSYYSVLEHVVMWLVGVCAIVGVAQLVALAWWKPPWRD